MAGKRGRGGFRPGEDIHVADVPPAPSGLVFTAAAAARGTDTDILLGYRVFLGRDPESSFVIAEARQSPVGAFIRALMLSDEFRGSVLDRLETGSALPHLLSAPGPADEETRWLLSLLDVPDTIQAALRAQTHWPDWFRTLVTVPGFLSTAPAILPPVATPQPDPDPGPEPGFMLVTLEQPGPGQPVSHGERIQGRGWAIAPADVVEVAISLDGQFLALAQSGESRPDVAASFPHYHNVADCGFSFTADLPADLSASAGLLMASVRTADGQTGRKATRLNTPDTPPPPDPARQVPKPAPTNVRLEVDVPPHADGAVLKPVRGAFSLSGWTTAPDGMAGVEVFCDDVLLGPAYLGMRREDIAAAFPQNRNALLSGFALVLPPGSLPEGQHRIRVVAYAAAARATSSASAVPPPATLQVSFDLTVLAHASLPPDGDIRTRLPPAEAAFGLTRLARQDHRPHFHLVLAAHPGTSPDIAALDATLRSLHAQVYSAWTVDIGLPNAALLKAARSLLSAQDGAGRIRLTKLTPPARAKWVPPGPEPGRQDPSRPTLAVLLRPGDRLGADALLELALESAADPGTDFIYGDELRWDAAQNRRHPFFKPEWSPELLLAINYVGRPWCATATLLDRAGLTTDSLAGIGDYEAVLRLTENAARIGQVTRVLTDRADIEDTVAAEREALQAALARRAVAGIPEPGATPGTWRIRRQPPTAPGRISIIIPTCGARRPSGVHLIRAAIRSIRATSAPALAGGQDVEIVLLDNIAAKDAAIHRWLRSNADIVLDMPGPFNWSRFNNRGAEAATGEFLLFLNDDIECTEPGWLEAMLEHARRPDVGVVGARLLYPNGQVQHAGQYLAAGHARHAFRFVGRDNPGPFGLADVAREVACVTGACQMVRATVFAQLGRFNEAHDVVNNDVDFCLRSWRAGLAVLFTPYANLVHHELASRATLPDTYDAASFAGTWRTRFLAGDPFRSPRLGPDNDHYGAEPEPAMLLHAGRRGPLADAVRRILVVKLDHIGDFLTALPALRSLARRFPNARLDLLAPAATAELARQEPSIAETIVFDFFHARSAEGRRSMDDADLRQLAERLAPARYDIAVDMRMHPDTRIVLPYTGAGFLAGYDRGNHFGFLDVALEWEGDDRLIAKRAHISERLLQLVSALEDACRQEPHPPAAARLHPSAVPALAGLGSAFLARPLVCIHPGVGNLVRQWPAAQYAGLLDLLAASGVHAVLVGAPEEAELAGEIIAGMVSKDAVRSLVGKVRLANLADVMRACVLFVGNNSGPQHLAASLGLPTVGIHSGVVDAAEWAPLGSQAVAIRRRMVCSPCYLEFASDCPRNLACLTGLRPQEVFAVCRRMLPVG